MVKSHSGAPLTTLQHLRRTLSRTLLDILIWGLVGVLVGATATEAIGGILTKSIPTTPTHVAAGVIALLLGYALAVTVAFRALLKGITQSAEWVVDEVERVVGGVVHETESVLHIPEDIAHLPRTAGAHDGARSGPALRQPVGMLAGISDEP